MQRELLRRIAQPDVAGVAPANTPAPRDSLNQRTDSREVMKWMLGRYLRPDMLLYDVGCGAKPFAEFLQGKVRRHISVDIDHGFYSLEYIDLVGSADNLPIDDETADAILSSLVIEHLPDPMLSIREAFRVLTPGGYLFLSYPFLYPIHAAPYDFTRLTRFSTERALRETGFNLLEMRAIGGFWYVLGSMSSIYLNNLPPLRKIGFNRPMAWLARNFFGLLHTLEGASLRAMNKDVAAERSSWPVCYVLVAQKPHVDG